MRGWLSSWAIEAASSPMVETRVKWESSWRLRWASISTRFRSVTSVCETTAPPSGRLSGTTVIAIQRSAGTPQGYSRVNPGREPSRTSWIPASASPAWSAPWRVAWRQTSR